MAYLHQCFTYNRRTWNAPEPIRLLQAGGTVSIALRIAWKEIPGFEELSPQQQKQVLDANIQLLINLPRIALNHLRQNLLEGGQPLLRLPPGSSLAQQVPHEAIQREYSDALRFILFPDVYFGDMASPEVARAITWRAVGRWSKIYSAFPTTPVAWDGYIQTFLGLDSSHIIDQNNPVHQQLFGRAVALVAFLFYSYYFKYFDAALLAEKAHLQRLKAQKIAERGQDQDIPSQSTYPPNEVPQSEQNVPNPTPETGEGTEQRTEEDVTANPQIEDADLNSLFNAFSNLGM